MNASVITRAMTSDGSARIICADTTAIVQKAFEVHKTAKTMTAALGRSLTVTSLMGSLLKDKTDTLSLQIKGDGPAGTILCVSNYRGDVRGYAENPDAENVYGIRLIQGIASSMEYRRTLDLNNIIITLNKETRGE